MLHTVAVAFCDTSASDLSLRLGLAPQPALSTLTVELAGCLVEIRLLGHSHQVLTWTATGKRDRRPTPGVLVSEVVACLPSRGELPTSARHALPGADYSFRSHVAALTPPALARRSQRLRDAFSQHPAALVGAFPGLPHALTVVLALAGQRESAPPAVLDRLVAVLDKPRPAPAPRPLSHPNLAWCSWHLYPQTDELVFTFSRLRLR